MYPSLKAYKFLLLVTVKRKILLLFSVLSFRKYCHCTKKQWFHQIDCFSVEAMIHTEVPVDLEKDVAVSHASFIYFIIQKKKKLWFF